MRAAIEKALGCFGADEPFARVQAGVDVARRQRSLGLSSGDSASRTCWRRASSFVMMIAAMFPSMIMARLRPPFDHHVRRSDAVPYRASTCRVARLAESG